MTDTDRPLPLLARTAVAGDFFWMRSPLLPLETLVRWIERAEAAAPSTDRESGLREELRSLLGRPDVREAIHAASPSLGGALSGWLAGQIGDPEGKLEQGALRYLFRMIGRATPFGLLAGSSTGRMGAQTSLRLAPAQRHRRVLRLDRVALAAINGEVTLSAERRAHLRCLVNGTLYPVGESYRLQSVPFRDGRPVPEFTEIRGAPALSEIIAMIQAEPEPLTLAELERRLGERLGESPAVASEMVTELVSAGVLVCEPAYEIPEQEPPQYAANGHHRPYVAVEEAIRRDFPATRDVDPLFSVDLCKPLERAVLASRLIPQVLRTADALVDLGFAVGGVEKEIEAFIDAYLDRYGLSMQPLVKVLDPITGIGYPANAPDYGESELGRRLRDDGNAKPKPPADEPVDYGPSRPLFRFLLELLTDAAREGRREVSVTGQELMDQRFRSRTMLPPSFSLSLRLRKTAQGLGLIWDGLVGPSGARLAGRFCAADPELFDAIRGFLKAEETLRPRCVFAEFVCDPPNRGANIVASPGIRRWEIPYLGWPSVPSDHLIGIQDLWMGLQDRRVVFFSERLGCEVVPRLTSAINHRQLESPSLLRFFGGLQRQEGAAALSWSWGPFGDADFLPRVVHGDTILRAARWRLSDEVLRRLREGGDAAARTVDELRARDAIPRFVYLIGETEPLLCDLDNPLSARLMARRLTAEVRVLEEALLTPGDSPVEGSDGTYVHEIIVPFLYPDADATSRQAPEVAGATVQADPIGPSAEGKVPWSSRFGSQTLWLPDDWAYVKIYAARVVIERLLRTDIQQIARGWQGSGLEVPWFFVRFSDPRSHLRLRARVGRGAWDRFLGWVRDGLQSRLASGEIWRFEASSYEPEWERYGGAAGLELAEKVFTADSWAVLDILALTELPGARWQVALRGMARMLDDFAVGPQARSEILSGDDEGLDLRALGGIYRTERAFVEDAVRDRFTDAVSEILDRRSRVLRSLRGELAAVARSAARPEDRLVSDYVHMFANRLLAGGISVEERSIRRMLLKAYRSLSTRSRQAGEAERAQGEGEQ